MAEAQLRIKMRLLSRICPKYVGSDDRRRIERSVSATLQRLRAQLDAGQLKDSGVKFHSLCLDELANLPASLILDSHSDLAFIYGCMYNMADRCGLPLQEGHGMKSIKNMGDEPAGTPIVADDVLEFHAVRLLSAHPASVRRV